MYSHHYSEINFFFLYSYKLDYIKIKLNELKNNKKKPINLRTIFFILFQFFY